MVVENSRVQMRINISQMIIKFDPSSIHVGAYCHCQIMDREEESVCCKEIPACVSLNQESAEFDGTAIPECITDNPVFLNICLNVWLLRLAWSQYRQQYGAKAFEGPEHKKTSTC